MVCPCGAVSGPAGSGGESVYKCMCRWELLLCVRGLSPPFEFLKQWLP